MTFKNGIQKKEQKLVKIEKSIQEGDLCFQLSWSENTEERMRTYSMSIKLGDKKQNLTFYSRIYCDDQFLDLIPDTGLRLVQRFGDNDASTFTPDSPLQVLILEKAAD